VSADDKAAAAWDDYVSQQQDEKIKELERQLNAANERIKQLEDARTVAAANSLANMLAYEDAVAKIKRLEEAIQERDKEWFQVIESILGFHPVSMTEALHIGIDRIKKQKQRIKRLEEAGDRMELYAAPHDSDKWNEAKESKP
jgi:TolA-binding protein